jgi:hypothetical protein
MYSDPRGPNFAVLIPENKCYKLVFASIYLQGIKCGHSLVLLIMAHQLLLMFMCTPLEQSGHNGDHVPAASNSMYYCKFSRVKVNFNCKAGAVGNLPQIIHFLFT